jgi:guanidinobutyrase
MSVKTYLPTNSVSLIVVSMTAILLSACASNLDNSFFPNAKSPPTDNVKLQLLTEDELAFLRDPKRLRWFNLTEEKVLNQLAQRDEQGVKQYVTDMMATMSAAGFQDGQDKTSTIKNGILEPLSTTADSASIPLNVDAQGYNKSKIIQPAIFDKYKRTPGPINLQRYVNEQDGIPTFAGAPVAIRTADLVAGQVEVAFVGVPLALGSGWRDSQHAPTVLRGMYGLGGYDIAGGVDPTLILSIADFGNIATSYLSTELNVDHIREQVSAMIEAGTIPFIVGGDHSIMYPTVAAMSDSYGKTAFSVVQLDAHFNGKRGLDHYYSDAQSVSRLLEDQIIEPGNLIQVGLRGPSQDKEALEWLRETGVKYHTMVEVEEKGWDVVQSNTIAQAKGAESTFVSFDMSVLDPAYAPGAGRPIPGGISILQGISLVRRLCAETKIIGFELLDVAPYLDTSYKTALNANYIMHACLTGIAMRKQGITGSNHLDPLAFSPN